MQHHRDIVTNLGKHPGIIKYNAYGRYIMYKVANATCASGCSICVDYLMGYPEIEGRIKHCAQCAAVLATVLPPRDTFLQRREFAGRAYILYKGRNSCLMCYEGLAEATRGICELCHGLLEWDIRRFAHIWLLCGELVVGDVARLIVGYLARM